MKKILAWALVLLMVVGLFAGCTNEPKPTDPAVVDPTDPVVEDNSANLASALEYLETMYKTVSEITGKDFTRPSSIPFGLDRYDITWTTNTDEVKVVDNGDGTVTIDVNEEADEDTPYELTATLTASNGKTVSYTWKHLLPKAVDVSEIFNEAFALADGESMGYEVTLTGVVTMVNTAYSPDYKNVTVTIEVPGYEGKAIQCYRMKGDGADEVGPGWTITVTGTLTNYKGTVQFGAGCIMDSYTVGEGAKAPEDPLQIVKEAYELAAGASLPYNATLTGIITGIDTPYDPGYGNVSVTIAVAGAENSPILCYRMKGTGADNLYVGDVITVKGLIKNYNGTIEFDAGCQLLEVIAGERVEAPTDPYEILDAAYALKRDESLPWPVTLSGIVTTVDDPYSEEYNNITVTITLPGANDQPIKCFRMKGDGIAKIKPSDTITVTGVITNYEGEREFKAGCQMIEVVERGPGYHAPETQEEIVEHIENLPITCTLLYKAKLTGEIVKVNSAYSSKYGNITVTIGLKDASGADFNLKIYRMKEGTGLNQIKKGDTITVEGYVTHYVHNWEDPKNNSELEMVNAKLLSFESGSNVPAGDVNYPTAPTTLSEDKAYKLVMIQGETEQVLVFDGGINSSSYLTTTTDPSKYVDVYVEKESDGYRFYFMDGNVKKYIELYVNSNNKARPEITETPDQVWKYDAASKLYTITLTTGNYTDPYYLGTYSNFNTISSSSTHYVTGENAANYGVSQFAAILMEEVPAWDFGGGSTTPDPDPEPETGLGAEITNPNVDPTASLKVVIYAPAYAKALSTQKTGYNNYYNLGVDVAAGASGLTGYSDTEVWDVIDNGDGTYSFANGGKKIGLAASNSSMNLDAVNDTWTVEALGGGLYNLKNVGRGNYMEWYAEKDNWSTYGSSSAATDDQFQLAFYVVAGTLPTFGGGTTPDPEPEDPTPDPEPETPTVGEVAEIVIYNPANKKALSTVRVSTYYNKGVDVTINDTTVTGYGATEIWKLIKNEDGTYSFTNNGDKLSMAANNSSMPMNEIHDKWEITYLGDGLYNIKNVGRGNYMEWYSSKGNWSTYGSSNAATDPLFQQSFYVVSGSLPSDLTGGSTTPDPDPTPDPEPETPAGNFADFDTIVPKTDKGDSSYTSSYTTTNGWVTTNSAIQTGGTTDMNPQFIVVGPDNTHKAVCMTGHTSNPGKITSPVLTGGISKLTINYTKMFTDTQLSATITITDKATNTEYTQVFSREEDKNTKYVVWTYEWVLETPVSGDFTIEIVNNCPTNQAGNKARMTVLDVIWEGHTGGSATPDPDPPPDPEPDPTPDPEPDPEPDTPMTEKEIVDAAFALAESTTLAGGPHTLTGVIVNVDTPYDSGYKNITVTIEVEGTSGKKNLQCFRLTGDNLTQVAALKVTDTITVTGTLKNHYGKIEFDAGCKLVGYVAGAGEQTSEMPQINGTEITFNLGANGSASHYDGTGVATYTETVSGYTLSVNNGVKFYTGARDAKGNSCIKLGTGSAFASFQFTVPAGVTQIVVNAAGYKAATGKIAINGVNYAVDQMSNDGLYTQIVVNVTAGETITVETVVVQRAMINSISFVVPNT